MINYLGIMVCCTDHKHSLKACELNLILLYMHKPGKIKAVSLDLKGFITFIVTVAFIFCMPPTRVDSILFPNSKQLHKAEAIPMSTKILLEIKPKCANTRSTLQTNKRSQAHQDQFQSFH